MKKGTLFVVSGPSGCGKGTILAEVLKDPNLYYSVSATTRAPRPGEVDGVNYRFMTNEAFEKLIAEDGFLEYAGYCEHITARRNSQWRNTLPKDRTSSWRSRSRAQ